MKRLISRIPKGIFALLAFYLLPPACGGTYEDLTDLESYEMPLSDMDDLESYSDTKETSTEKELMPIEELESQGMMRTNTTYLSLETACEPFSLLARGITQDHKGNCRTVFKQFLPPGRRTYYLNRTRDVSVKITGKAEIEDTDWCQPWGDYDAGGSFKHFAGVYLTIGTTTTDLQTVPTATLWSDKTRCKNRKKSINHTVTNHILGEGITFDFASNQPGILQVVYGIDGHCWIDREKGEDHFSRLDSAELRVEPQDSYNDLFELTAFEPDVITIKKAEFKVKDSELKVEAESSNGGNVTLTVVGYDPAMDWDGKKHKYKEKYVADPGDTIVVESDKGGRATKIVKRK